MKELLKLIKPKTLPDGLFAYLNTSSVLLDFGLTKVVSDAQTSMPLCVIPMKELFSENLEKAMQLDKIPDVGFPDVDSDAWIKVPINLVDASVFNCVASAGESTYWAGRLVIKDDALEITVAGTLYFIRYIMPKLVPNVHKPIVLDLTWDAFYYLYKMFSDVTAKKPDELHLSTFNPSFIKSEKSPIKIKVVQDGSMKDLLKDMENAETAYYNLDWGGSVVHSKKFLTDSFDTLFKHVGKPFKDNVTVVESAEAFKMTDGMYYTVYLNKRKAP